MKYVNKNRHHCRILLLFQWFFFLFLRFVYSLISFNSLSRFFFLCAIELATLTSCDVCFVCFNKNEKRKQLSSATIEQDTMQFNDYCQDRDAYNLLTSIFSSGETIAIMSIFMLMPFLLRMKFQRVYTGN
jgi:hypothetical protein